MSTAEQKYRTAFRAAKTSAAASRTQNKRARIAMSAADRFQELIGRAADDVSVIPLESPYPQAFSYRGYAVTVRAVEWHNERGERTGTVGWYALGIWDRNGKHVTNIAC